MAPEISGAARLRVGRDGCVSVEHHFPIYCTPYEYLKGSLKAVSYEGS